MTSVNIPVDVKGLELTLYMINNAKKSENDISKTFYKDVDKKFFSQILIENDFLSHHKWICPDLKDESIMEKIDNMELTVNYREDSKHIILNPDNINSLGCMAQNIILFDGPNFRTSYNFIKKLITDVKLIGAPSGYGYAMSASLHDKYKNIFVIKAPQQTSDYSNVSSNHELVVGKILNNLRSFIPNFACVFGGFECGPPVFKPSSAPKSLEGKIISWCRGGKKVKYLMYENVLNSVSFYDFCKGCSAQEYIDIIIQVNYALMTAYKKYGFTHYDLHGFNLLIKTVKDHEDGFYIPYGGDFVYANYVATIIDYGMSHVYLPDSDNVSVGFKSEHGPKQTASYISSGIYSDRPNPMYDCYKILNASLSYMKQRNGETYNKVVGLLYFFHPQTENLGFILEQKESSFIPNYGDTDYKNKISKFRYENFIKYCREYCNLNDMQDPVVSGKEYTPELDEMILFSPVSMNKIKPSYTDVKLDIDNIDELFDIIEPIIIYKQSNIMNKTMDKKKIEIYNGLLDKVYDIVNKDINFIINIVSNEMTLISEIITDTLLINYTTLNENSIYLLRSQVYLQDYLNTFEKTVYHLDTMDFIERRIEMIKYIDYNILKSARSEIDTLHDKFRDHDDRNIFIGFLKKDVKSIGEYIGSKDTLDKLDEKIDVIYESMLAVIPV